MLADRFSPFEVVMMEESQPPLTPAKPRLRCANREREDLRPRRIDDLIDDDHPARIVWAFVSGLDLAELYARVKAVEGQPGSPAIDARILMAVWLYATIDHQTSARRIADLCETHNAYRWLCGGVQVNHHTLSDFYTDHGDWLNRQFTLHLASLMQQGLVEVNRVAQDGVRVRASAGAASFRRGETLEECLQAAEAHLEQWHRERAENPAQLNPRRQAAQARAARERCDRVREALRQLPEVEAKKKDADRKKARVSTTDPDARVMKMPDGGFRPAFNAQLATDTASQIIVGVTVVNEGSDQGQLSPMLEQIHTRTGAYPDEALVDGGFASKAEIEQCAEREVIPYAPVAKPKDDTRDRYQPLPDDSEAVAAWRQRMGTHDAKTIYKERAATAECVNAIARNRGLRQLAVRGLEKAKTVLLWFALAHNVMREAVLRPAAA
jgi:transposase